MLRRTTRIAGLLAVLAGCANPRPAPTGGNIIDSRGATTSPDATDMRAIDALFARYDGMDRPGASVLVVRNGRVVVSRSYGLADLEEHRPATPRTNYRLASLSKQFTAMAIMQLVTAGKLRYDDRVTELLPALPAYARDVRVRHLLTHTSGLPDYEDFVPDSQTRQVKDRDVIELLHRSDTAYFLPGAAYRYSNTGYALLALIAERVSGLPYARYLRERIFAPVGMQGTVAYEAGVSSVEERAYGYSVRGDGFIRTDQSNTSAVLGDGGIYSSIHDLVAWDRALDTHLLVDSATMAEAWSPTRLNDGTMSRYGFGWFVDRDGDGLRLTHHGETRGFTNFILKQPDRRLTVVILTNRIGGDPWDLAARVAALPQFAH